MEKDTLDGMNKHLDYKTDTIPHFPDALQGNSAEGHIIEQGMKGFGKSAAPARDSFALEANGGADAPGAFIQGNNPANSAPAGSEMSGNNSFNPGEQNAA